MITDNNDTDRDAPLDAPREGKVARTIEKQPARVPSDMFLWAAGGAVATSWVLRMVGKKEASNFVSAWVPSILICGVYNKIVKTQGHDRADQGNGSPPDEAMSKASATT